MWFIWTLQRLSRSANSTVAERSLLFIYSSKASNSSERSRICSASWVCWTQSLAWNRPSMTRESSFEIVRSEASISGVHSFLEFLRRNLRGDEVNYNILVGELLIDLSRFTFWINMCITCITYKKFIEVFENVYFKKYFYVKYSLNISWNN